MEISEIIGRTFTEVKEMNCRMGITLSGGRKMVFLSHEQECCEDVFLEDIVGDLPDLVGNPILRAEERSSDVPCGEWTFYELATIKGSVTLRFFGTGNAAYSLRADVWEEDCPR